MKALISPNEMILNPNTQAPLGVRVCDIVDIEFEVAEPLFWVSCEPDVTGDTHFYDVGLSEFDRIPEYVPPPQSVLTQVVQPISNGAQTL